MTAKNNLPIIVAGGGIGGLSAAILLAKKGRRVIVLEKTPEIGEIGYGIQIGPNGCAMLRRMGIFDALQPSCFYPDALVMVDAISAQEITRIDLGESFRERYKNPYLVVHRRDLQAALKQACLDHSKVQLEEGKKDVLRFDQIDGYVVVHCADGSSYEGAALVGAEGKHSPTRSQIVGGPRLRATGHVVYRGLVPTEQIDDKKYLNSMVIYVGPGVHLVQYRLRGGTVMNNVATFESPAFRRGEKKYGSPEELAERFEPCAPEVKEKLRYFAFERNWVLDDGDPLENWSQGNATLLGDAAHATLQYLAQGAIMAMEDAAVLAEEVDIHSDDYQKAFLAYQGRRLNRTARVVLSARLFGEICHAAQGARLLRNELLSSRLPDQPWESDWLYHGIELDEHI
jgi:2-polyprenyl-6-methoxyphenol hydroxylase-like FAD-dependent oxidoreductase